MGEGGDGNGRWWEGGGNERGVRGRVGKWKGDEGERE